MKNPTYFKFIAVILTLALLTSCEDEKDPVPASPEVKTVTNLHAPQTGGQGQPVGGTFALFSFSKNSVVSDGTWDIAFRGTTILVNGGTVVGITDEPARTGVAAIGIVSGLFDEVKSLPETSTFKQDGPNTYAIPTGSSKGWYNYNPQTNIISPMAGKVFVVKTHNGKYAKFEILSYYKDAPANPDASSQSRYFTFKYVYLANGSSF